MENLIKNTLGLQAAYTILFLWIKLSVRVNSPKYLRLSPNFIKHFP